MAREVHRKEEFVGEPSNKSILESKEAVVKSSGCRGREEKSGEC